MIDEHEDKPIKIHACYSVVKQDKTPREVGNKLVWATKSHSLKSASR